MKNSKLTWSIIIAAAALGNILLSYKFVVLQNNKIILVIASYVINIWIASKSCYMTYDEIANIAQEEREFIEKHVVLAFNLETRPIAKWVLVEALVGFIFLTFFAIFASKM